MERRAAPLEALLDDPWAADPVANRTICNGGGGGGGGGQQQSFTRQQQEQAGRSESQPNSYVQGFLKGVAGNAYDLYTKMPGGNPVPDASRNTQGFWTAAGDYGGTGMGGGTINPLRDAYVANTLRGDFLNLDKNPYSPERAWRSAAAGDRELSQTSFPALRAHSPRRVGLAREQRPTWCSG